jgi:hypothetical protein
MTLKEELDELADACSACADSDDKPYDQHMMECTACQDYNKKAESMVQMVEVLQLMATKPEEERYNILKSRIESFLSMDDSQRKDAISNMLDSLGEVSEDDRVNIVRTRTNILMKMPREQRTILMDSLKDIMGSWSDERKMMEQRAVMAATEDLMLLKKVMVRRKFQKLMA